MAFAEVPAPARKFLQFVNASPSPFHAVNVIKTTLLGAGFTEVKEAEPWACAPKGKYFFTRNQSTIIAFAVGGKFKPGNGFSILGAHSDSPCLRVKPTSTLEPAGYLSVGVECYGGGLWNTWFDRDLSVAGRVMVRQADGSLRHTLVRVEEPILRIPNLAIHLNRGVNDSGFQFNLETQLVPVLATAAKTLNASVSKDKADEAPETKKAKKRHHSLLLDYLAKAIKCDPADIGDFELCLYDTQPSAIGGANAEFIFSPRLDNLMSAFTGLEGFLDSLEGSSLDDDENTRVLAVFDHEECGSDSAQGAGSQLFGHVLRRLSHGAAQPGHVSPFEESILKSFVVSSDMAHAVHPNYSEKHEANHRPQMNKGPVIKFNSNQRYATNSATAALIREAAVLADVPIQDVMVRNDSACGSTIGPILSSGLGIRTVDIGNPQLSMHSIREMSGVDDVGYAQRLFKTFFQHYSALNAKIHVD